MARFYLDEHVGETLIPILARRGHDVLSTRQAGNKGLSDPRQLRFARHHDRVMVTFNDIDFAMLHEALVLWISSGARSGDRLHAGIAILPSASRTPQADLAAALDDLPRFADTFADRCFRWVPSRGWEEVSVPPFAP